MSNDDSDNALGSKNDAPASPNTSLTATSGELCPCSGEWEIVGQVSTSAVFSEGKMMPEYYGTKVIWVMIRMG